MYAILYSREYQWERKKNALRILLKQKGKGEAVCLLTKVIAEANNFAAAQRLEMATISYNCSDESLDKTVTDSDVYKLAAFIVKWEDIAGPLRLGRAKQKEIQHIADYGKQKRECVEEWREREGDKSTYRAFIDAAREVKLNRLADKVVAMLREHETPDEGR